MMRILWSFFCTVKHVITIFLKNGFVCVKNVLFTVYNAIFYVFQGGRVSLYLLSARDVRDILLPKNAVFNLILRDHLTRFYLFVSEKTKT